ncbi:oligosaccharide flippase family protein [Cesiribacter andamanensis]|uniref:Colanic acid exporter n=1 Tax=Cesiribacter andamanensis AMV16 TaxID=1279009 RepID=M7N344_9BACT|nr:oligosaccharide flippase family protein [Cesiribacter andamanensis]EMR03108.1 colanic acid exporter [Cesiribacter andamanensis AMV16]
MKKLFQKIFSSYWFRSGAFKLFERVSLVAFGLFTFYVLVRYTSKEEYGTWSLYITLTTFLELMRAGFVGNGLIRYIGQSTDRASYIRTESAALLLNLILTLITSAIIFASSSYLSGLLNAPLLEPLLWWYGFLNLLMLPLFHLDLMQQANMDFKGSSLGQFALKGSLFVLITAYVLSVPSITMEMLVLVQAISILIGTLVMFIYGRKYLTFRWKTDRAALGELFHFGKYTFGTHVSAIIVKNVDSWMLAYLINPAAVAVYSLAIRVSNIFEVPTNTVSSIVFPQMVKEIKEKGIKAATPLYEKSVALLFALLLPTVLLTLIFAEEIVLLIAEERYADAVPILQITALYGLLLPFNKQVGIMMDSVGDARKNMLFVIRNAVLNIVLNYFLITKFGVMGAALATLTTYFISLVLNQIYINRKYQVSTGNYIRYLGWSYSKAWSFVNQKLKSI